MKHVIILLILTLLLLPGGTSADIDILFVGSSKSYSDNIQPVGMVKEKAFDVSAVADQLRNILSKNRLLLEKVNVVYEDVHREKVVHTDVAGWKTPSFRCNETRYICNSLAQYYMWPADREKRLKNLRGEAGAKWDYVIITGDPYIIANFPGVYAAGVSYVAEEVAKGTAKPVLLAQWPDKGSSATADDFNEIAYRVGDSGGITVIPGAKAWKVLKSKDSSAQHPSPHGAYLAAACIYAQLFNKNPGTSGYRYKPNIAAHAVKAVRYANQGAQYKGVYNKPNVYQMKYDSSRHLDINHTGSSTESGFLGEIQSAISRCQATSKRYAEPSKWPDNIKTVNFNYGRANSMFEPAKKYDPANCNQGKNYYERSYGFPMQDHAWSADKSMEYGIDWRRLQGAKINSYDDGTDLGIAFQIIKKGAVLKDVRAVPIHLMIGRCRHFKPELKIQFDTWHFSAWVDEAVGTFIYTLQSGRCPMTDEPADKESGDWNKWLGRKIGYETAWQLSHLTTRAPGFQVRPASNKSEIAANGSEDISIRFMLPPQKEVTVGVFVDVSGCVNVSPRKLTFTPENYNKVQTVSVKAKAGKPTKVRFETRSEDPVYNLLQDSWAYKLKK